MDQDCTVGYSKFFAAFVGKQSPLIMSRYEDEKLVLQVQNIRGYRN